MRDYTECGTHPGMKADRGREREDVGAGLGLRGVVQSGMGMDAAEHRGGSQLSDLRTEGETGAVGQ